MGPKKGFSDGLERRKLANGHSTIVRTAMNKKPEARAIFHGFHAVVFCQKRSRASARTTMWMGNLAGTRWVTGLKVGPGFGGAGRSGKIRAAPIANIMQRAPVEGVASTTTAVSERIRSV